MALKYSSPEVNLSRDFLLAASMVSAFLLTDCLSTSSGAEAGNPNIVFFMADDWSWPHAGILGDPVVKTPNFDRVAREGVLFENAFVSTPSCTPSRFSILTGQHHWRLKEGDSLGGSLREEFDVYTEMLEAVRTRRGSGAVRRVAAGPCTCTCFKSSWTVGWCFHHCRQESCKAGC